MYHALTDLLGVVLAIDPPVPATARRTAADEHPVRCLPAAADNPAALTRRIRLLVAVTISYHVADAVVAIAAGAVASSTALIGFGIDSVIEVSSAVAVALSPDSNWQEDIFEVRGCLVSSKG